MSKSKAPYLATILAAAGAACENNTQVLLERVDPPAQVTTDNGLESDIKAENRLRTEIEAKTQSFRDKVEAENPSLKDVTRLIG